MAQQIQVQSAAPRLWQPLPAIQTGGQQFVVSNLLQYEAAGLLGCQLAPMSPAIDPHTPIFVQHHPSQCCSENSRDICTTGQTGLGTVHQSVSLLTCSGTGFDLCQPVLSQALLEACSKMSTCF